MKKSRPEFKPLKKGKAPAGNAFKKGVK